MNFCSWPGRWRIKGRSVKGTRIISLIYVYIRRAIYITSVGTNGSDKGLRIHVRGGAKRS